MLQNFSQLFTAHLLFATKPKLVRDFFALATTVTEGAAVEEERKSLTTATHQGWIPGPFPRVWLWLDPLRARPIIG